MAVDRGEIIGVPDSLADSSRAGGAFRADIQALRALAVLLVVVYHAHIPGVHGGFLGVDVFFVISGFVITNVLLKERSQTAGTSFIDFYGRRIRRILPAATVVIIATIFATYHWLSFISGAQAANDAKWVTAFIGNFHFAALGTNYFTQNLPPSTLQQFWSLAVEEQFYLVWPLLFALSCILARKRRVEFTLVPVLVGVIGFSLWWSILQTSSSPISAFYSPLTRAWELALGALLAVTAPRMTGLHRSIGHTLRIAGLLAILLSTWFLSASSEWPGAHSIIPVVGSSAMIAGGSVLANQRFDLLTSFAPIQWIGLISYSLYLVHWPILTIASEYSLTPLPLYSNLELVLLSIGVAAVSYYLVERPMRSLRPLVNRRSLTYALGALLIAATYGTIVWHLHNG